MIRFNGTLSRAALALALGVSALAPSGCNEPATPNANTAAPASNAAAPANTNVARTAATNAAPGQVPAPPGMEDTITGRVIGIACYKKSQGDLAATVACTRQNAGQNEALVVLAGDGTVYMADADVRTGNALVRDFIGQEVTVQGQMGEDAPELGWDGTKVKKFRFKLVRRVGPPPADAPKMNPTGRMGPGRPPAAPPANR